MELAETALQSVLEKLHTWLSPWVPAAVPHNFWMPDHICHVCYECEAPFSLIKWRNHCRLCGRIFCTGCTALMGGPSQRVRVCSYCLLNQQGGDHALLKDGKCSEYSPSPTLTPSSSSGHSTDSTLTRPPFSPAGSHPGNLTLSESFSRLASPKEGPSSPNPYDFLQNKCDGDCDDDEAKKEALGLSNIASQSNEEEVSSNCGGIDPMGILQKKRQQSRTASSDYARSFLSKMASDNGRSCNDVKILEFEDAGPLGRSLSRKSRDDCEGPEESVDESNFYSYPSEELYEDSLQDETLVDIQNNMSLWIPPPPEDEEDEIGTCLLDDYDDDEDDGDGSVSSLPQSVSSFGSNWRGKEKGSLEEQRKAMRAAVDGHFRVLVTQLLVGEDLDESCWFDIVLTLSVQAASLVKPDRSKGGGGMDPGGYVKVKCVATGQRSESRVIKGVVCSKNVANRHMTSQFKAPRLLLLGGALEYYRVSNQLSSIDALIQQEHDYLNMTVSKIEAQRPNILLVEKSVARFAHNQLLGRGISLVSNVKRPVLERIARCTGAQIVPSLDTLLSPICGFCELFHVEKYTIEEHGNVDQQGRKRAKTLMFLEGCPKPLGCTVLLKGANDDELSRVKRVVQFAVFASYHLSLETSFLADEGATLPPDVSIKSPLGVSIPDKRSETERSITTIPGFLFSSKGKGKGKGEMSISTGCNRPTELVDNSLSSDAWLLATDSSLKHHQSDGPSLVCASESSVMQRWATQRHIFPSRNTTSEALDPPPSEELKLEKLADCSSDSGFPPLMPDSWLLPQSMNETAADEFPPSPSDHQSILVFFTSGCLKKGVVCERGHLFRIKYYGSFDKPLGRFLRETVFNLEERCTHCEEAIDSHVHCYTHQQGSLTISVQRQSQVLPGYKTGKIWMWHRCLKCSWVNGNPCSTRRIVMSDAAWGLSFGKFLELSFSNHAAVSRAAVCGHSLHRDCLRFYGSGDMVACFRYAPIRVHNVYLPPFKLQFNQLEQQEWLQNEVNEVLEKGEAVFTEVTFALKDLQEKMASGRRHQRGSPDAQIHINELEASLVKDKLSFLEAMDKVAPIEHQTRADILQLYRLRRALAMCSTQWQKRIGLLMSSLKSNKFAEMLSFDDPFMPFFSKAVLVETDADVVIKRSQEQLYDDEPKKKVEAVDSESLSSECTIEPATYSVLLNEKPKSKNDLTSEDTNDAPQDGEAKIEGRISNASDLSHASSSSLQDIPYAAFVDGLCNSNSGGVSLDPAKGPSSGKMETEMLECGGNMKLGGPVADAGGGLGGVEPFSGLYRSQSYLSRSFRSSSMGSVSRADSHRLSRSSSSLSSVGQSESHGGSGGRVLLPLGVMDTVIAVYDDEPTSIIAYALLSHQYQAHLSEREKQRDGNEQKSQRENKGGRQEKEPGELSSFKGPILNPLQANSEQGDGHLKERETPSTTESRFNDPLLNPQPTHVKVSFTDDGPRGKIKFTVTCYYAKQFDGLRKKCCSTEMDFIRSLCRCKKWMAQGGKSKVFFAKTSDDRFVVKQVTKTELESFIQFAPAYFQHLSGAFYSGNPTCLAKIFGVFQVDVKHRGGGGKEARMDVMVMENLLYGRHVTRIYDLKGSERSRYNADATGKNKVLLDQNLLESMQTNPIFINNKAKHLLQRAVWNDTSFLANIDVMDYSLLVGVDEMRQELVIGIIDFMRQYTWDKHLETWVKSSLGGPKSLMPTVISPKEYKKRFRKAMSNYFLMLPDQWLPPPLMPGSGQNDKADEQAACN